MENFDNNVEKLMQELAKQNKRLFVIAQVLGIISVVFFLGMFLLACFTLEDNELAPGEGNGNPLQFLAWKMAWTEESGRLQFRGLQKVGHD